MYPFHTRGWAILAGGCALSVLAVIVSYWWVGLLFVLLGVFGLWFHRNPSRTVPENTAVVSPTDGTVRRVEECPDTGGSIVTVYLGLSDVHFIRSIRTGQIESVERYSGKNLPALFSMSEKNNRVTFTYESGDEVTMFTGVLARRLLPLIDTPMNLSKGSRIGLISFGSRVQFTLTTQSVDSIQVSEGDEVIAGETPILK